MFFGAFSMQQVHAANVMEGIFQGMVASTDPASVRTASRVGAVGGSFSYRQPQVNTNLVNVSFPKASVGCNGIDIFLGSFSMINGDQLVQIGRGNNMLSLSVILKLMRSVKLVVRLLSFQ